jgi:hypothetical protein
VIPLRPLGVGEILDGAFTTIRRYPAATLLPSAIVTLLVELVRVPFAYYLMRGVLTHGDLEPRTNVLSGVTYLLTFLSGVVLSGILTSVVGQGVLGRPTSAGAVWQATRPLLGRLLGASFLIFLILVLILGIGTLPGLAIALAGATEAGLGVAVFGGGLASLFVLYVGIALTFTTPVLVLEKQGIKASLRRSRALMKGCWWRVFGITLLALLIAGVISAAIVIPFSYQTFGSILSGHAANQYRFTPLLLAGVGGAISGTLVGSFRAGVVALLYLDQRMRTEALDLTLQRSAAGDS